MAEASSAVQQSKQREQKLEAMVESLQFEVQAQAAIIRMHEDTLQMKGTELAQLYEAQSHHLCELQKLEGLLHSTTHELQSAEHEVLVMQSSLQLQQSQIAACHAQLDQVSASEHQLPSPSLSAQRLLGDGSGQAEAEIVALRAQLQSSVSKLHAADQKLWSQAESLAVLHGRVAESNGSSLANGNTPVRSPSMQLQRTQAALVQRSRGSAAHSLVVVLELLSSFDDGRAGGLHKLLGAMDTNHSGALDRHELRRGLHTLGMDLPADGIDALLSAFDRSGDGLIDFSEFYSTLVDFRKVAGTMEEAMRRLALALSGEGRGAMRELLQQLDVSGDGLLSRSELRNGLEALGMRIGGEALDLLMAKFDRDGNGYIDSDEFCATLESVKSAHGSKYSLERPACERSAEIQEISALLDDIAQASEVGDAECYTNRLERAEAELQGKVKDLERLESGVSKLRLILDAQHQKLQASEQQALQHQEDRIKLEGEVARLSAELARERITHEMVVHDDSLELSDIRDQVEELMQAKKQLQTEKVELHALSQTLTSRLHAQHDLNAQLQAEQELMRAENATLDELRRHTVEISTLEEMLDLQSKRAQAYASELERKQERHEDELASLRLLLEQQTQLVRRYSQEMSHEQQAANAGRAEVKTVHELHELCERQARQAHGLSQELSETKAKLFEICRESEHTTRVLDMKSRSLEHAEQENSDIHSRLESLHIDFKNSESARTHSESELLDAQAKIVRVESELALLKERVAQSSVLLQEFEATTDGLRCEAHFTAARLAESEKTCQAITQTLCSSVATMGRSASWAKAVADVLGQVVECQGDMPADFQSRLTKAIKDSTLPMLDDLELLKREHDRALAITEDELEKAYAFIQEMRKGASEEEQQSARASMLEVLEAVDKANQDRADLQAHLESQAMDQLRPALRQVEELMQAMKQLQIEKGELVTLSQTLTSQLHAQHDLIARLQAEQVLYTTTHMRSSGNKSNISKMDMHRNSIAWRMQSRCSSQRRRVGIYSRSCTRVTDRSKCVTRIHPLLRRVSGPWHFASCIWFRAGNRRTESL